jgi:tetratricopeptide (TPR) repeat protein
MIDPTGTIDRRLHMAFALAQQGKTDACLSIISEIRRAVQVADQPDLAVKVICLEGICAQYSGNLTKSFERLKAAQLLGSRYGSIQTSLFAMGWLALCNYNAGNLQEAIQILADACKSIELAESSVRFRVASLLSMLHTYSGERKASEDWFAVARREAFASGDRLMMSALIYNVAALRVSCALAEFVLSDERSPPSEFSSDLTFMKSAENYDSLVGAQNQFALHSLLQALSLVVLRDYNGASDRFSYFIDQKCATRESEYAKAEFGLLLCDLKLGRPVEGSRRIEELLDLMVDDDDLLFAHYVLVQFYRFTNQGCMYDRSLELFASSGHKLVSLRAEVRDSLHLAGLHSVPLKWPVW